MPPFRRMLVALAGRDSDCNLLNYAAMIARVLPQLEVHCVHVGADFTADITHPELSHMRRHVLPGDLLDCLLDFIVQYEVDLVLLGHSSQSRRRRSLARRLAMQAPCSVWMVPDGAPISLKRILVPSDFSHRSADTLDVATALAEQAGLDECLALHVYFNEAPATYEEFDEILAGEVDQAFGLFVAPINLHSVYAKPMFVEAAHVAPTILRVAADERSDLIVMGTRGRSASAAVLLGSETEQVLMATPVPILAVKRFGAQMRLRQALREEWLHKTPRERYT